MQQKEKAKQLKIEAMQQKVKKSYDQEGGSLVGRGLSYLIERKNPNFFMKAKSLETLISHQSKKTLISYRNLYLLFFLLNYYFSNLY